MILDVDMGNTRLKWRLRQQADIICRGAIMNDDIDTLFDERVFRQSTPLKVYVASVVPQYQSRFDRQCQKHWGVRPVYAVVEPRYINLINGYDDIAQMGVDRWLAMVAAYTHQAKPCLVIACGSATTADIIDAKGCHLGSYIAPGLDLMRKALCRDTHRIKLDRVDYSRRLSMGTSTKDAVASGLLAMQAGLALIALKTLSSMCSAGIGIHVTGGDGRQLLAAIAQSVDDDPAVESMLYTPELVLDGLVQVFDSWR
ncbi:MAG: type III pantothenate kinase [Cellvibrionaceae bacterium]|nr:type III pantothenate kinase [Cellvibrionaceae bacterium]